MRLATTRGTKTMAFALLFSVSLILQNTPSSAAEEKVPIVATHNNQIRVQLGDRLRLECPVHSTSGELGVSEPELNSAEPSLHDVVSSVMYHWRVRNRLDYMLDSDPRYHFSQNRRVLEITVPVEATDSGTYTCTGVTGFGKREVSFDVQIRDPNADLLCAKPFHGPAHIKVPCFVDPTLKQQSAITVEAAAGTSVEFNCEAEGTDPIRYRWLMGHSVADWIPTSQGTRGPVLRINHVGREHTGHFTCQVSNPGGSVNYTYRLVVTDPASTNPKIISTLENQTFTGDDSASIVARIQCACDEPVIQWLKRVEPGDDFLYRQSDIAKIPLPNARDAEQNEIFRVLGTWDGSPATVDPTILLKTSDKIGSFAQSQGVRTKDSPSSYHSQKYSQRQTEPKVFLTRIHLQKPLEKAKHSGKYVLMTMRLSDVKSMEYVAVYVDIVPDANFLKGRRILLYFLVPFSLLFIVLGTFAYMIIYRRRGSTAISTKSTSERCMRGSKDAPHVAYHFMSNGRKTQNLQKSPINHQLGGKHFNAIHGAQSPLLNPEMWPRSSPNTFDSYKSPSDHPYHVVYYPTDPCQEKSAVVSATSPLSNTVTTNLSSSQRTLPYPPSSALHSGPNVIDNRSNTVGSVNSGFDAIYTQTETAPVNCSANSQNSNPPFTMAYPTAGDSDLPFDQYSAVSRTSLSTSTVTNPYTLPFNDYTRSRIQHPANGFLYRFPRYPPV